VKAADDSCTVVIRLQAMAHVFHHFMSA